MKRSRVIAFGRRFLLAAAAAVLAICFFVFPITPRTPGSDPRSLARLTGYSSEHSLAADELEPYRYVADLPQIERADVGWSVEAETLFFCCCDILYENSARILTKISVSQRTMISPNPRNFTFFPSLEKGMLPLVFGSPLCRFFLQIQIFKPHLLVRLARFPFVDGVTEGVGEFAVFLPFP